MAGFHEKSSSSEEVLKSDFDYGQFHHNIDPDCPVCHKPVFWCKLIVSAGRAYHATCFICSYCSKVWFDYIDMRSALSLPKLEYYFYDS